VPAITSSSACAALDAAVGRDVVAADDDAQFAAAVVELLEDRRRRDAVGAAGRRHVERHHDWNVLARELIGIYGEAQRAAEARRT
jgi:glycosyltransferase involved in cell wall biosynthesis